VVWDKAPNLTVARFDDVFIGATNFAYAAMGTSDRFIVLHHKKFASMAYGNGDNSVQTIDDYVKLPKNLVCNATMGGTGTGGIGERQSGALLLFCYSDAQLVTDAPVIQMAHRIFFEDV